MKYVVAFLKLVWTIVKVITIPVGAIALFLQFVLVDSIGFDKSLEIKSKMYEEGKTILANKMLENH